MKPKNKDLRSFGVILGVILLVFALSPLLKGKELNIALLIPAAGFVFIGFIRPSRLEWIYTQWMKVAHFIGNIFAKVMLFVLYFFVFAFVSFLLKLFKKDLLNKKIEKERESYWIKRETQPQPMINQF